MKSNKIKVILALTTALVTVFASNSTAQASMFEFKENVMADKYDNRWPAKREYADPAIIAAMEAVRAAIPKAVSGVNYKFPLTTIISTVMQ